MASSVPPTPRSSVTAPIRNGLFPPNPQSCPSSAVPSPSPPADLLLPTDTSRDEPDPTIIEALSGTKDRLFVLKLGDDFDNLLGERGNTPGKRCSYTIPSSYQRLLVHRCAQYYKLAIEVDGKTIWISVGQESRVPKARIAEIVPMEQAPAPAFKIMRRSADERARAKQPGLNDSTEEDNADGAVPSEEPKRRAQMTIEERAAAYEQARLRIFEGFQEKEVQPSPPPTRRDSGNSEPRWVDKQRRSDFSSRGSPIPQDNMSIPASYYPPMLFNPHAPNAQVHPPQFDPSAGQPMQYMYGHQVYYPPYGYYPQPQYDPRQGPVPGMQMGYIPPPPSAPYPYPPQHAATWPPLQPPPGPPQHHANHDAQRHAFPLMNHQPPPRPMPHMPMSSQVQNDPFPPHQYMQPYQYAGFVHQPVLVPTPPDGSGSNQSSRSGSRNGHGNGHGSSGSNGGAKGPRSSVGSAWNTSTVATPMRSVTGMNRRLSTSSSSTSAYSSSGGGGAGSGSRTPADETASIASSASSSSSRRTYTSTSTTSKHPLPPRPDWAVGLLPEPPLSRTTSTSSNDSRLRLTSRSSSGNQVPRAGSVNVGPVSNVSDFPPLNGNGSGNGNGNVGPAVPNGTAGTGVWNRDGPPAQLFNGANPPTDESDPFKRPPPKSWGLYNPNTDTGPAALPVQVRSPQEGGPDALADQVSKLSVDEGGKSGGT